MEPRFGSWSSSVDPSKLAESVERFLKVVGFVVMFLATKQGVPINEAQALYQQLTALAVQVVPAGAIVWNSGHLISALLRKLLVKKIASY